MGNLTASPIPAVDDAVAHIERQSARLIKLLGFVPDDKLGWSPSSTARSSIRIIEHCSLSNEFFTKIIAGKMPETMPSPEEFFRSLRGGEGKLSHRTEAVSELERTSSTLTEAIRLLDAESLESTPANPFGPLPMRFWLKTAGEHLDYHEGQLAFLQTIWNDQNDHMG